MNKKLISLILFTCLGGAGVVQASDVRVVKPEEVTFEAKKKINANHQNKIESVRAEADEEKGDNFTVRIADNIKDALAEKKYQINIKGDLPPGVFYKINPSDLIIGIASSQKAADALSQKKQAVFVTMPEMTLSDTVKQWAKQAGYKAVIWNTKFDYKITIEQLIYGQLKGNHGALDQLLSAFSNDRPLEAKFLKNGVIMVSPSNNSQGIQVI